MTRRIGISDRLMIAFAAVATLAVAANMVVERGATTLVAVIKPAEPPSRVIVREVVHAPVPPPTPAEAPADTVKTTIDEHAAVEAVQDFERLVVREATAGSPQAAQALQDSATRLRNEVNAFLAQPAANDRDMRRRASALTTQGALLVQAAPERREHEASYATHFDNLDARMQKALDGSWKIFGRVIAQQSLVALSLGLDDIRRSSSTLAADGWIDRKVVNELTTAQDAFAKALEHNTA
ncbi:MAG: hypothetical protein JO361_01330, partial [Gammaproteobacteria bacterium]|nr:hypothetical protein [Gammaproteobacteria bacterium]